MDGGIRGHRWNGKDAERGRCGHYIIHSAANMGLFLIGAFSSATLLVPSVAPPCRVAPVRRFPSFRPISRCWPSGCRSLAWTGKIACVSSNLR